MTPDSRRYLERRLALRDEIELLEGRGGYPFDRKIDELREQLKLMPPLPPSIWFCGLCGHDRHPSPVSCPILVRR